MGNISLNDILLRELAVEIMAMEHDNIRDALGSFEKGDDFRDYVCGVVEMGDKMLERLRVTITTAIEEYERRQC